MFLLMFRLLIDLLLTYFEYNYIIMKFYCLKATSAKLFSKIKSLLWNCHSSVPTKASSPSTAVNLLSLPSELLVAIFERVPLFDLVAHLPLTCVRFARLSELVRTRVQLLTLLFGSSNLLDVPYPAVPSNWSIRATFRASRNVLYLPMISNLTRSISQMLVQLFPNVRALQLSADGITTDQLDGAINETLLKGSWRNKLEALHLVVYFDIMPTIVIDVNIFAGRIISPPNQTEAAQRTLRAISQMTNLRRLVFLPRCKLGTLQLFPVELFQELCLISLDFKRRWRIGDDDQKESTDHTIHIIIQRI